MSLKEHVTQCNSVAQLHDFICFLTTADVIGMGWHRGNRLYKALAVQAILVSWIDLLFMGFVHNKKSIASFNILKLNRVEKQTTLLFKWHLVSKT